MYGLRLVESDPSPHPLDLAIVKRHLARTGKDDDLYINELCLAAMLAAENATRRQIITASWELQLDRFPSVGSRSLNYELAYGRPVKLPRAPWQATNYVKYYDTSGVLQTWSSSNYTTAGHKEPAEIWPVTGKVFPVTRVMPAAVLVGFDSGYGADYQSVPALLKHAMLLLVGHWYQNREAVVVGQIAARLPIGVEDIFEQCSVGDDFDDYGPERPTVGDPWDSVTATR